MFASKRCPVERVCHGGDVACGEDARCARLQIFIDAYSVIELEAGCLRQTEAELHADSNHHHIGLQPFSILQDNCALFDARG